MVVAEDAAAAVVAAPPVEERAERASRRVWIRMLQRCLLFPVVVLRLRAHLQQHRQQARRRQEVEAAAAPRMPDQRCPPSVLRVVAETSSWHGIQSLKKKRGVVRRPPARPQPVEC